MTSPRTYRAFGVTLRRSPVREADLLTVMYTRDYGKLELLARGAQRLTSKLMGHLEPLTLVRVSVARGRTMDQVTEAEVVNAFPAVKHGYENSARGLYVAELVDGFSALSAANAELFDITVQTLEALGSASNAELALRYFDLQLLRLSGFMPELYNCVECGAELEPDRHRFAVGAGGALCADCGPTEVVVRPLSLPALKLLRLLHRTESVAALPALAVPPPLEREVRETLAATLQYWLDRRVRSQEFLEIAKFA
ncbi:MAG: DNA repair protein RecO [Chloroflexota bacterium]|nr:DNA repair protein RecO [Chloroflexota bacterium]MDE2960600.1 DNA repair protein RecO [Chloroflexota bacterium]